MKKHTDVNTKSGVTLDLLYMLLRQICPLMYMELVGSFFKVIE